MHKAKFDISKSADISFVNATLPVVRMHTNPMQSVSGSPKVRVKHFAHGFVAGDMVAFEGVDTVSDTPFAQSLFEGTTFTIESVEYDSYIIDMGINATASMLFGGDMVDTTHQIQYSTVLPNFDIFALDKTDYTLSLNAINTSYVATNEFKCINKSLVEFTDQMLIASYDNEVAQLGADKSFNLRLTLSSFDENVSPVIHNDRASLVLSRYRIDNKMVETANNVLFDEVQVVSDVAFDFEYDDTNTESHTGYMQTANAASFATLERIKVGNYIVINGGTTYNQKQFLVTGMEYAGVVLRFHVECDSAFVDESGKTASVRLKSRFINEISPLGGSSMSACITRPMNLAVPATGLKLTFDANVPHDTDIEIFYKTTSNVYAKSMAQTNWNKLPAVSEFVKTSSLITYKEYDFEIYDREAFDSVQIKIVPRSNVEYSSPKIKNLRLIAVA
jgi:hypothetical protein